MNDWKEKSWGRTMEVISLPMCTAHRFHMDKGGFSSMHSHRRKWNAFVVVQGLLRIVKVGDGEHYVLLGPGDVLAVPPDVVHRMEALTDVEAVEWYWPDSLSEDIERLDEGGRRA